MSQSIPWQINFGKWLFMILGNPQASAHWLVKRLGRPRLGRLYLPVCLTYQPIYIHMHI
jgi:hypothetical protein